MADLLIRAARPDDAPVIVELQLRMARETEDLELDRDTLTGGVEAVFSDPRKGAYWVAEREGRVVGDLLTTFEWSDWRNGVILWIQSVYVVPEERGRGVYRALYEHLKRRVEADPGLKGIRLYVDKRNTDAQRVYERLGMTREHYDTFEWLK
ncbi:MAG TPA: GNAT family N-acetyltransferase [Thermoanaerobaculia bacterium]|jgi:GNAT superfamily N-acetyltransferase|nr:GNAT family N-acetyltransferase [Thermoanaerobaculia bacterium]